jgi:hypothetical protein
MMYRAARTLVQYYAALRLSAAAATLVLPAEARDRPPVVRYTDQRLPRGFDRREVIFDGSQTLIVTLATAANPTGVHFSPN